MPSLALAVCATLSLFFHVAVPPTASTIGFGEYAVVVNEVAPLTIDTGEPDPFEGVVGEDDEPQAAEAMIAPHVRISRIFKLCSLSYYAPQVSCRGRKPREHASSEAIARSQATNKFRSVAASFAERNRHIGPKGR